jgi:capsid protein
MVYGSDKLLDAVRGVPILACMLYMLKELDRYRDAESRAAVINAMIPLVVKRPMGAKLGVRPAANLERLHNFRSPEPVAGVGAEITKDDKPLRVSMDPGTIFDNLAPGEEIESYNTMRPNTSYKVFEEAIINVVCWVNGLPPENGRLLFTSSYSASRQGNNELELHNKMIVVKLARDFCSIIFSETTISFVLLGKLVLPGFLQAYIDRNRWMEKDAWLSVEWMGLSRQSIDLEKDVRAAKAAIDLRISTYDQQSRKLFGQSARTVWLKQAREKEEMRRLGLVSSVDEDNNGQPLEQNNIKMSERSDFSAEIADRVISILEERGLTGSET